MKIEPLPKNIYEKALALKVKAIELNFSGGSDQGDLNVSIVAPDDATKEFHETEEVLDLGDLVEKWADNVYPYSGAGDGNDYGDDIAYDLVNNTASHSSWYTDRHEDDEEESPLEFGNDVELK
jgi:hypothetical protein